MEPITLTPEQAAAFQRGESITLEPPLNTFIVVLASGTVWEVKSTRPSLRAEYVFTAERYAIEGVVWARCLRVGESASPSRHVGQVKTCPRVTASCSVLSITKVG